MAHAISLLLLACNNILSFLSYSSSDCIVNETLHFSLQHPLYSLLVFTDLTMHCMGKRKKKNQS